jgi:predicted ATP-dependent endonuclease of OLD family
MSHVIEFYVEGLAGKEKGFGHKLNRDINIFFGLNGSGKTSLLKILHSALSTDTALLANTAFTKAEVVIESLHYKRQFRYSIDCSALKPSGRQKRLFEAESEEEMIEELELEQEVFLTKSGPVMRRKARGLQWKIEPSLPKDAKGRWEHKYLPTSRLILRPEFQPGPMEFNEDFYDTFFARELERHWNGFFGGVQSEVRRIQEQGIANILTELLSAKETPGKSSDFDWEKAYERVSAFFRRQKLAAALPAKKAFQAKFRESPVLQRVVERIDALEEQISRAMDTRTKLQTLVERLFSGNKRLVLGDTSVEVRGKNDTRIGLQSLSSGEKHILRILFEVMSVERSTLIIDEPEISLHIDWQRELVKAIMELNPHIQLIAATHSPEVTAEIEDSKIFQIPV